jgi:hypothetical protein
MINWNRIFDYRDGELYWKIRPSCRIRLGAKAGCVNSYGYVVVGYKGKHHQAHRIIWEMHNGCIPTGLQIDHINRVRNDNRIDNLRLATAQENMRNSDSKGFYFEDRTKYGRKCRFKSAIYVDGKCYILGYHDNMLDARAAYLRARKELFGEFA